MADNVYEAGYAKSAQSKCKVNVDFLIQAFASVSTNVFSTSRLCEVFCFDNERNLAADFEFSVFVAVGLQMQAIYRQGE